MAIIWCPHCDNITHLKKKCKRCKGKGIVKVGRSGVIRLWK